MPITLNGSGTITGISAGGLPDAIITQPELAAGVAGNGPAFRVYLGTVQTLSNATDTKVNLSTEIFDTASCFNNTGATVGGIPAYAFLPNVAGYYQFNANIYATATVALSYNFIQIWKNGSQDSAVIYGPYSGTSQIGSVSALIYLNGTTDYVELYSQISGTGTLQIGASSSYTFFSGSLARAA
jgi:hypothetical protein